jgi:putative sugar O-methyltransferase
MDISSLAKEFIKNSPEFHSDLSLGHLDKKHIRLLSDSYREEAGGTAFHAENFRNWKGQSDMAVPAQLAPNKLFSKKGAYELARYVYISLFQQEQNRHVRNSLLDDIAVIQNLGGDSLLKENPVDKTPGATYFYRTNGTSVNIRWLRYIYLLKRILDLDVLCTGATWVDVGSYYGGLQSLVFKYRPECTCVMVDFHHQLCRSYLYLKQLFPTANHLFPNAARDYLDNPVPGEGSFVYLPVRDFTAISENSADLVTNFFSLGEMRREFFNHYFQSRLFQKARYQFLVNRFVSSPYFEPTYDSDITVADYLGSSRKIEYFDVFPMHHFLQIKRELFGRNISRNTSSSYFEMVTTTP